MTVLPPQSPWRTGDDARDLLGAYALDAVDDVERARVERLLREDADAAAEAASFRETASRLAVAVAATPPPALRARVLAEVARTRQEAPSAVRPADRRRAGARSVRLLAAACGVLLVGCLGLGAALVGQDDPAPALVATGELAGGTAAVLQVDDRYVVVGEGLEDLPADRVYQLWAVSGPDAAPVPAGFLAPAEGGGLSADLEDWRAGDTLAVTEEPTGGSPAPTGEILTTVAT
ncbi:anti-sigma factor [Pseudokineococcus lusitanus]|uniref:Regulator of SigK n=1 Tax=Pseudokineococcus lusitanus TaxID=763993 RepID=A0A3N1HT81_9ACTN|nr:anti-sigma factor [Pseudokineococcus lusitanus]ROP45596.1 anti-sigma-K factor RskA [Pseudokineococcus lusitanus]